MTSARFSPLIVPPFLEPGDTIGIATPASPYDREPFETGLAILRQWGYSPQLGRRGIRKKRYLAGSDSERAEELMDLFQDPAIKAILCARGGYGAMRLLDRLDYPALGKQPKMFIGFSDITVLLLACFRRAHLLTFHGPMVTTLARLTAASRDQFRFTLRGAFLESLPLPRQGKINGGRAQGLLLGGNLTLLAHLVGTPFEPDWTRAILFVEDEGEPGYRHRPSFCSPAAVGRSGADTRSTSGAIERPRPYEKGFRGDPGNLHRARYPNLAGTAGGPWTGKPDLAGGGAGRTGRGAGNS